ncbi:28412_t:CDS:2, partial [Racocetra persica]
PENDAVDLTLEIDESQFFNSENEEENETNSSQDDLNSEKSQLQLHIGFTFDTWKEVDKFLESYRKFKGFSFQRSRTNFHSDNSGIRRRSYEYSKSRVHKAKKIVDITKQHKRHSTAIDCEWHVNFNNHKGTTEITCTLFEANFKHHWVEFIAFLEPFPKAFHYALETLYSMQSINGIIKKEVSHSTTLLYLVDTIQNRLNEEAHYAQINEQKNMNPTIGLPHVASHYFSAIDSLLREYLTPYVLSLQKPENIIDNECREDDYEQLQIDLKSLLQNLRREYVEQINNDEDLIATLQPIRLCGETNQLLSFNNVSNIINFGYLSQFRAPNTFTPALKKSISEKTRWAKGYGMSKKALNLMIHLNCDDEFYKIMEEFISSKTQELQLLEEDNNDKNNVESHESVVVINPIGVLEDISNAYQNRDRLNTDNTQEKRQNKCANCGSYGHNVRTCANAS